MMWMYLTGFISFSLHNRSRQEGPEEGDNARRLQFCRFILNTDIVPIY